MPQFPVGPTCCDAGQRRQIVDALDKARRYTEASGYPVYLGEFGAYEKSGTPEDLRVAWTAAARSEAERRGFGWAYWQFEGDFIVWDMAHNRWVQPILKALIP